MYSEYLPEEFWFSRSGRALVKIAADRCRGGGLRLG